MPGPGSGMTVKVMQTLGSVVYPPRNRPDAIRVSVATGRL
jgi:hypothetical protein